jgi:hypothetical protein
MQGLKAYTFWTAIYKEKLKTYENNQNITKLLHHFENLLVSTY